MQCTLESNDENYKEMMTMRLVNRWKSWEQPLLILSFFLHPSYKLRFFTPNEKVSHINLNKWAQYYFFKWFGKKPISMIRELLAYKENKFPFNESSLQELEKNPLDYWSFLSDSVPELSQIATKLFSICVNSASCERLFSTMGFLHTKRRNRLNYSKVLWMAQIRGELKRQKFMKNISIENEQAKNDRIAVPIGNDEAEDQMETLELDMDNDEVFYDESDNENDENDDNNECDEFIRSWLEILEEEDTNNGINNISGNQIDEDSSEFNALLENQIHSADNDDAKWDLTTLFKLGLEAPGFFYMLS
ncbi:unnamed protein product [Rhizophagus irregularis]|nr:unnamed protein product [Rhizophagus irregularis]CAB5208318.1 unnamed protein product [Rhizophagus irregularis]